MKKYVDGVLVTVSSAEAATFESERVIDPSAALVAARASWVCTQMQGILALGESNWSRVLLYRDTASWAEKVIIDSAQDWRRNSENLQFIGHILGFKDEQMDSLFEVALLVDA